MSKALEYVREIVDRGDLADVICMSKTCDDEIIYHGLHNISLCIHRGNIVRVKRNDNHIEVVALKQEVVDE